ncbi:MAG: KH domain-containing protein [Oscillospiraceae bacterium]|nr:KH domain-containing protein [Oscillospiraceae bacterium]
MTELLIAIAKGLVDDPDSVRVDRDEPDSDGIVVYHLHVAEPDMGKVIGKQGKIARAIRIVMRAGAGRINERIMVEID